MSNNLQELEFEPEKEYWNTYTLEDYTRVKARVILLRLLAPKLPSYTKYNVQLQAKTNYIFVVSARPESKGPPGPPLTRDEIDSILKGRQGQIVRILESKEEWNVYRIIETGETFKMKLVVSDVYRVPGRFDPDGEPVYVFIHTTTFMPGPPYRYPTP